MKNRNWLFYNTYLCDLHSKKCVYKCGMTGRSSQATSDAQRYKREDMSPPPKKKKRERKKKEKNIFLEHCARIQNELYINATTQI